MTEGERWGVPVCGGVSVSVFDVLVAVFSLGGEEPRP